MNSQQVLERRSIVLESIKKISNLDSEESFNEMRLPVFLSILNKLDLKKRISHLPANFKKNLLSDLEGEIISTPMSDDFSKRLIDDAKWYESKYCPNIRDIDKDLGESLDNILNFKNATLYDLLSFLYEIQDLEDFMQCLFSDDFSNWLKGVSH